MTLRMFGLWAVNLLTLAAAPLALHAQEAVAPACPEYTAIETLDVIDGVQVRCSPFSNGVFTEPNNDGMRDFVRFTYVDHDNAQDSIATIRGAEAPFGEFHLQIHLVLADTALVKNFVSGRMVPLTNVAVLVHPAATGTTISYNRATDNYLVAKARIEVPSEEVKRAWDQVIAEKKEAIQEAFATAQHYWIANLESALHQEQENARAHKELIQKMESGTHIVIPE